MDRAAELLALQDGGELAVDEQGQDQRQDDARDRRGNVGAAECRECRVGDRDRGATRQDERQAAGDGQHAERDDERRDLVVGDPEPVPDADQPADRDQRDQDRQPDIEAQLHQQGIDDGGEADHRAYRQIDAADQDDHRHADADNADDRDLAGEVAQVARGQERVVGDAEHGDQDDQSDQGRIGLDELDEFTVPGSRRYPDGYTVL